MQILGIESSCDETGVAIYDHERGLIAHEIYSQVSLHNEYGGVVPELASRDHIRKLFPLIEQVLVNAGSSPKEIDAIAYTAGPGLAGALLVGASAAHALAYSWQCPIIPIHHMEGHLLAPLLEEAHKPSPPFLALLVSGGHTQLIAVKELGDYEIIGESVDDAVGEAFDKTAKILGLAYPGGPIIEQLATQGRADRYKLPRPMLDRPGLMMSFSGLKTAVLHRLSEVNSDQDRADLAASFQQAVVDTLVTKCHRALKSTGFKQLVIAGGVGANQALRQQLQQLAQSQDVQVFFPSLALCTDNGAMIAYAGYLRFAECQPATSGAKVFPRWPIAELSPIKPFISSSINE